MRHGNLPDGGHDKIIWKRSRDRCRDKASRQRNFETLWRRTTATLLGVSFGSSRRRRINVLNKRTNGTSCIRTTETSWWRTTETPLGVSFETCLRRRHDILIRRRGDVPLIRLGDVQVTHRWVFYLRCYCDVARKYRETSLQRRHNVLLPGGLYSFVIIWS